MAESENLNKIVVIGTPYTRIAALLQQNQAENTGHSSKEFTYISDIVDYYDEPHTIQYTFWNVLPDDWKKDRDSKHDFYRDVAGAILVCDYGYSDSLDDLKAWKSELNHYISQSIPTLLLCIKNEDEVMSYQMVQETAADLKLKHYETSISNPKLLEGLGKIFIKKILLETGEPPYLLKIVIIGSYNRYKTQFVRKFADHFSDGENFKSLGHFPGSKSIRVDKKLVKLILIDLDGREFFGKLRPNYYRGASACIIVFDKSDRQSFDTVPDWQTEFRKNIPSPDVPFALVGIKTTSNENIPFDEGKSLADQLDLVYFEISSPTFKYSYKIFNYLIREVFKV